MRRYLAFLTAFIILSSTFAQELYWENPQVLIPGNALFPQVVKNQDGITLFWQQISRDRTQFSIYSRSSIDGIQWSDIELVLGPIDFYQERDVSLFSVISRNDGTYLMALPTDGRTIVLFGSTDGLSFTQEHRIQVEKTALSPKLFENSQGRAILFFDKDVEDNEGFAVGLDILYSEEDPLGWTEPSILVDREDLSFNILPNYISFGSYEYTVFQSLFTGTRITWQLYLKRRPLGTSQWEEAILLTDFTLDEQRQSEFYTNQRPYLNHDNERLYITWERNFTLERPQIYVAPLNEDGRIVREEILAATEGYRENYFPRLFQFRNEKYLLWFDNRLGNQIILSPLAYTFRGGQQISSVNGDSTYGIPLIYQEDLYLFWENRIGDNRRYIMLAPDKSVIPPVVRGVGFQDGQRKREQMVTFSWNVPQDSSGIRGYRYSWNREPVDDPSKEGDQRLLLNPQPLSFQAEEDGLWYFHLSAQDMAGNWSEPVHYSYFRDRTPPMVVEFLPMGTDEWGFARSNSMEIAWRAPEDEDLAGYNYTLSYLGNEYPDPESFPVVNPEAKVIQTERAMRIDNLDDGFWRLQVISMDRSGNLSRIGYLDFKLNKYRPVTYISWVSSEKDELDRIQLQITGRGYLAGGAVRKVYIDQDQQPPYDYQFLLNQDFNVLSDRRIQGPLISVMEAGTYFVAVEHPRRGLAWGRNQLRLDSTGTVKYGDFSLQREEVWELIQERAIRMVLNDWTLYFIFAGLLLIAAFSLFKGTQLFREGRILAFNSKALIENTMIYSDALREEAKRMKKRGLRLRAKFALALLSLVISIVLMVSIFLGRYMMNTQQISLGEALENRSALMLDTLISGGKNYLPSENRIQLRLLPNQISAMEGEALWTTILGKGELDPDNFDYIWSSSDETINFKQLLPQSIDEAQAEEWMNTLQMDLATWGFWYESSDQGWDLRDEPTRSYEELGSALIEEGIWAEVSLGESRYLDAITIELEEIEREINEEAQDRIGEIKSQLEDLNIQARRLLLRTDTQSREELAQIQLTITKLNEEINLILLDISDKVGTRSYPPFDPEDSLEVLESNGTYIFYKPILYSETDSDRYYKGSVRLAITLDPLLSQLKATQNSIFQITIFAFIGALFLGLVGAFMLSTSMIRPIKELAAHVQIISETEDKKALKDHVYPVRTADEIGDLGNIINNMTHGLVEAAKANEDLMAGKDIQKAFIPLEVSRLSEKKHTTGKFEDDDILIFGYYEGAKAVSGDYFDFRQLDDEHFAIIKCDIAGKGVAASLIMVEVATIFVNYFRNHKPKEQGVDLADLVWTINDLLNEVGFRGRFAAFNILLLNKKTGQTWMCHAGDREVNMYDSQNRKMFTKMLNDMPTAGSLDSDLLRMQNMEYTQIPHLMKKKDIIFLYTDGIEEAQNLFRTPEFVRMDCDGSCGATETDPAHDDNNTTNHIKGESFEEFTTTRIHQIIEAVLDQGSYTLTKYHDPLGEEHEMNFDYSMGEGSASEAVLALIAAQFVFQLVPDPNAGELDRVMVDRRVDDYLKIHFKEYRDYFKHPMENKDNPEYIYYTHMKKDDQTDDLTILVIEKK